MSHRFFTSRTKATASRTLFRPQVFGRLGLEPEFARWFPREARRPFRRSSDPRAAGATCARPRTFRVGSVDLERVWGLKDNKKARGALVAMVLVALAFLVSLVLS